MNCAPTFHSNQGPQPGFYTQEAGEIADLSFQSRLHFWRELVKWLYRHFQGIFLSPALPRPYYKAIYQYGRVQDSTPGVNAFGELR